jgi:pimeloyl-ACP methyl ester carboxylesterase
MKIQAFQVGWSAEAVARVLARVQDCQLPVSPPGSGWTLGCDIDFLRHVQAYWSAEFNWQAALARLNAYPQFIATIDDMDIHFVHVVGEAEGRRPLLLTHGWPGSHYEFWGVIEPLAYPSRFGGKAEDAFDLVIPSLPGFGFSSKPAGPMGQRCTAGLWNKLMTEGLGYERYRAQGGDFGAIVTSWLGLDHAASVEAIHLNMMAFRNTVPPRDDAERSWMQAAMSAQAQLGAYAALQGAKPQSLALATADNPLGQAAWILERFHDWADLRENSLETVFGLDHLLTNVMIYIMTGSFASSLWYYRGVAIDGRCTLPEGTRCETPTGYASFPGDALLPSPPRSRVELTYNLTYWSDQPRGGHFAAMEAPQAFIDELRTWSRN